jgi:hypothetical protein
MIYLHVMNKPGLAVKSPAADVWAEVVWCIERGWLTAREGDLPLIGSAPGWTRGRSVDP